MAGARHYKELIAWQLADQIRVETFKLTRHGQFARDFRHQSQAEDAVDSVCRLMAHLRRTSAPRSNRTSRSRDRTGQR
jgi:hypothetical protein